MRVSRRALLLSAGAAALEATLPFRRSFAGSEIKEYRLTAQAATVNLTGDGHPDTAVWAYGGTVPGPEVRIRQGDPVRLVVSNKLGEDTTVHWHGIRLPNAMDGVPGLTQPPIRPRESFNYEFTPPDAGTFWYHPHADSLQQLGRGLAGALIVEEREPVAVDRDLLWFIEDWRLDDEGRIAPGFGNRMEAGMSGRIGNTVTVNGRVPETVSVRAGERLRLRLVNAALARIVGLRFEGHQPVVVAYDGQPCDPHPLDGGRLVLGPAMRADLVIDMSGAPGHPRGPSRSGGSRFHGGDQAGPGPIGAGTADRSRLSRALGGAQPALALRHRRGSDAAQCRARELHRLQCRRPRRLRRGESGALRPAQACRAGRGAAPSRRLRRPACRTP